MFEPAQGFSGHTDSVSNAQQFLVLGPFAAGTLVESVRLQLSSNGTAVAHSVSVAAAIGASRQGNAGSLGAGVGIVQVSGANQAGIPAIVVNVAAGGGDRNYRIPVGVEIRDGSKWLIVGHQASVASPGDTLTVAVAMLRRVRIGQSNRPAKDAE